MVLNSIAEIDDEYMDKLKVEFDKDLASYQKDNAIKPL